MGEICESLWTPERVEVWWYTLSRVDWAMLMLFSCSFFKVASLLFALSI